MLEKSFEIEVFEFCSTKLEIFEIKKISKTTPKCEFSRFLKFETKL